MTWQIILLIIISFIVAIIYVINHVNTVDDLKKVIRERNDANERIQKLCAEIAELKRFPKPSDISRLDAALSEIEDLKSRLRIAEATACDATEKAKISNGIREDRKYYHDKYLELEDENLKLKEDIKKIKQKVPRPVKVYSDTEVEQKIDSYKKQLESKEEKIKSLKYELAEVQIALKDTKDDLEDCYDTIDQMKKSLDAQSNINYHPSEYSNIIEEAIPRVASLPFAQIPIDFEDSIKSGRLNNAFKSHLMIIDKIDMEAKIKSDKETYKTTLHSCTCPDFTYRHNVCKHMLFLSYTSGLLLLNKEVITQSNT